MSVSFYNELFQLTRIGKPFKAAEALGIKVLYLPFLEIKGIALQLGKEKLIMINENLTEEEAQLVCGHEIGHFFLHSQTNFLFILQNTFLYSKQEYQANCFAMKMMLGEKAAKYEQEISEAAASGKLDEMLRLVSQIAYNAEWEC